MSQTQAYDGIKFTNGTFSKVCDSLLVETPLEISLNNEVFSITMQTPGHEEELVRGLLFAEDICKDPKAQIIITHDEDSIFYKASVALPSFKSGAYLTKRSILSVASCGICGQKELNIPQGHLVNSSAISISAIQSMFTEMAARQTAFHETGGSHAAAAFTKEGQLLVIREDVGRHNAVDKVVGHLVKDEKLKQAFVLIVSGRVSYEILTKCFQAKIPILAAVSAPSSLAVDFAKELGITLLAFSRPSRTTIYAHPERILGITTC